MPKCTLCGKNYELPRGLTLVLLDGRALHFCSSKCRKNHKMRKGKKLKWVTKQRTTRKEQIEELKQQAEEQKEKTEEVKEAAKEVKEEAKKAEQEKPKQEKEGKTEKAEGKK